MDFELSHEEMEEILKEGIHQVRRRIYDMSVSVEVRKGIYTEDENKPLLAELERLVKVRDGLQAKLAELNGKAGS